MMLLTVSMFVDLKGAWEINGYQIKGMRCLLKLDYEVVLKERKEQDSCFFLYPSPLSNIQASPLTSFLHLGWWSRTAVATCISCQRRSDPPRFWPRWRMLNLGSLWLLLVAFYQSFRLTSLVSLNCQLPNHAPLSRISTANLSCCSVFLPMNIHESCCHRPNTSIIYCLFNICTNKNIVLT